MKRPTGYDRRAMLKGLGVAVSLPWLESLSFALRRAAAAEKSSAPNRMAFLYVPNGINMKD